MPKDTGVKYSFFADRLIVVVAYVLAIVGAWVAMSFYDEGELWMKIAIGDFIIFLHKSI